MRPRPPCDHSRCAGPCRARPEPHDRRRQHRLPRLRPSHGAGRGRGDPAAFSCRPRRRGQGRRRRATIPVTVADRAAETVIRTGIARAYPDHGIRGEEHGWEKGTSNYTWVIDPIDGTRSFILGQLHWATLIALNDGARVVAGVAHQPYVGESFVATAGGTAEWRRGGERRTLRTRRCRAIGDAVARVHPSRHLPHGRGSGGVPPRRRPRPAHALRRRLLRVLPARDGADRRRRRIVAAGLRRAGADPDHRGRGRGHHRLVGRPLRRRRQRRRLRRSGVACGWCWRCSA